MKKVSVGVVQYRKASFSPQKLPTAFLGIDSAHFNRAAAARMRLCERMRY
ncbi:hypothetical protein [Anaeromassilibacillus senegalensis]|nr:hypothetical protein [Anaeromassilibacillus senegalensis]